MVKLFNTLTRRVEEFVPVNPPYVGMYTCGQTVYDYTHIGHIKKYVGDDILKRVLTANGYQVKHVQNVTDVGHLVSDADEGDDKLEKGAKERGMSVWEVARFFEEYHFRSLDQVNILRPDVISRATEHIKEQIKLIEVLKDKEFTYKTGQAIYFDVSKFPDYTKLSKQRLEEKETGARQGVVVDQQKKHPADFALWFFTVGHFKDHQMHWPSPWGEGFPGWHIECSAMAMAYLGNTIDIHTGGIDHIPVHHTNEIAQSEAATGVQFSKFWVHHDFLLVDGEKMSKSKKNFYTIDDIKEKGYEPLAVRYLMLTALYRDKLNFTWESLEAAQNALNNIREEIRLWEKPKGDVGQFWHKFLEAANHDLNIPQSVAVLHMMMGSDTPTYSKARDLLEMDKILGLGLEEFLARPHEVSDEVQKLLDGRNLARENKDFEKADDLRNKIKELGFEVEDVSSGTRVRKVKSG